MLIQGQIIVGSMEVNLKNSINLRVCTILILVLFTYSCEQKSNVNESAKQTPKITVDTTFSGTIGTADYEIIIERRIDSILSYRKWSYWDDQLRENIRQEFFETNGVEYRQQDFSYYENDYRKSYVWYDTTFHHRLGYKAQDQVVRIESLFVNNGKTIKTVEYDFYTAQKVPGLESLPTSSYKTYFNSNGNEKYSIVSLPLESRDYRKYGNDFAYIDTDVLIEYAEWKSTSRTDYGKAVTKALEISQISAYRANQLDSNFLVHYQKIKW